MTVDRFSIEDQIYCNFRYKEFTSSLPLFGNGYQQQTFPFLWVSELSSCLNYQLLTKSHNNLTPVVI
jgi:hypothetical protein